MSRHPKDVFNGGGRNDRGAGRGRVRRVHDHNNGHGEARGEQSGNGDRGRAIKGHGEQGHRDRSGRPMPIHCLTEEKLKILSQGSSDEVYLVVNEDEARFLNTYKFRRYCNHPLRLKQMIKLLYSLVRCEDQRMASMMLAKILCSSGEYALFTTQIDQLLKKMPPEQRSFIKRENLACIDHLIDIGLFAIKAIPSTTVLVYPITTIESTIMDLAMLGERVQLIQTKFDELHDTFKDEKKKIMMSKIKQAASKNSSSNEKVDPPEPFTELTILPTVLDEMFREPFVRTNVIKGGYESWDHYFDVHFRLLREDFVRPLRKGITHYCDGSIHGSDDVRIYKNAVILSPVCLFTGIGFQLRFDSSKLKYVNWEHSRRLIFGSLLCLSRDNFNKSMMFATVVNRDAKLLKEGLLTIKFESDVNGFNISPTESLQMVESTAYYEAYRHVLEGLQERSKVHDVMPMKNYIVSCDFSDIKIPAFLQIPLRPSLFHMKDILETKSRKPFNILDDYHWPDSGSTGLDKSQLDALKMALKQEISVIQGPPGTGKTHIGLKIVETYLKNRNVWDPQKTSPILVVCYTNHALDQFLEGIQRMEIDGQEPNIIRVGGRCKSEILSKSTLKNKVDVCRSQRGLPHGVYNDHRKCQSAMMERQEHIHKIMKDYDLDTRGKTTQPDKKKEKFDVDAKRKIIRLSVLRSVIEPNHYSQLENGERGKEVDVWLGLWYTASTEQDFQFPEQASQLEISGQSPSGFVVDEEDKLSDNEYIDVDNEARVLHDERMIEGEEMELPGFHDHKIKSDASFQIQQPQKTKNQDGWTTVQITPANRKNLINKGFKNQPMTPQEAHHVTNIWNLTEKQRWKLYLFWIDENLKLCKDHVNNEAFIYNVACKAYGECQRNIDSFVARGADIIGMTTTGAAKYHYLLKEIHPKVVIFEEAAEILEAHVITSLASSVQQLIMIGDHQQLRPKPTCYDLEKKFELGVSLFERLILNNFPFVTLKVQHRMRPEISSLIRPSIYEELEDAEEVKKYNHVQGISKDVFFIDHTSHEEPNHQKDLKSHVNKFEAEYVVELCQYLLKQGYERSEITILTMYRGQLFELRKRMKREYFDGIRVAAVDDFQGEENRIILLSLVRSNSDDSIGFLNIENRVCVSLSRAKEGLYVIGNLSMLRNKHDTVWPIIIHDLERKQCVGRGLPLYCSVHPDDKIVARFPEDFRKRPEGGCSKICATRLKCGHACSRLCHVKDRAHEFSTCDKVCGKLLQCGHNCKRRCKECRANQKCLCSEYVKKVLPLCNHEVNILCSTDPKHFTCPLACDKILPCGHQCQNLCSQPCSDPCLAKVNKLLPCEHKMKIPCSMDPINAQCSVKCNKVLECGDRCVGTCGQCQLGRLHVKCKQKCGRTLVCGHSCDFNCASICPPCLQPCDNYCFHSKCPKKCYEPCQPCMEKCEWSCLHFKCTKACGQLCNRPRCDKPCNKILKCGHLCIGLCGEVCPKKCRICNKKEVCEIFFGDEDNEDALFIELQDCKHILEVTSLDTWMDAVSNADSGEEIQFKGCPKCKTPIRKSFRYGNLIKKVLRDMDEIKKKQNPASFNLQLKLKEMKGEMKDVSDCSYIDSEIDTLTQEIIIISTKSNPNSYRVQAITFQLSALPKILKVRKYCGNLNMPIDISGCTPQYIQEKLSILKDFLMQCFLSTQQISDCVFELRRLTCSAKLLDLFCKIKVKQCKISQTDSDTIIQMIRQVHLSGWKHNKLTEEKETVVLEAIRLMSNKYSVDGLSKEERIKIIAAIGLTKGHWFKCPKGHYYCIGECGGAMEIAKCPECGSTIGGQNHALATGNVHAGEIDGSSHAAWSDAANLENFDPAELARLRI